MAQHYSPYQNVNASSVKKKPRAHNVKVVAFRSTNPGSIHDSTLGPWPENHEGTPTTSHKLIPDHVSPARGRTMKEYDQQIAELKHENFNLKLRIYLLEETIQHKFGGSTDDLHKQNIELKVEVESLKKELSDKQELVIKAADGLETVEANYKCRIQEMEHQFALQRRALEDQIAQLQQTIENLEANQADTSSRKNEYYQQAFLPLHTETEKNNTVAKMEELLETIQKHQQQIEELQQELVSRDGIIKEEEVNSLKRHKLIQGLVTTVKAKEKEINHLQDQLRQSHDEIVDLRNELQTLKEEDEKRKQNLADDVPLEETRSQSQDEARRPSKEKDIEEKQTEELKKLNDSLLEEQRQTKETVQKMKLELDEKLQAKEGIIAQLQQCIGVRDYAILNCIRSLGNRNLNELSENEIHSLADFVKAKLTEKELKFQDEMEENVKRLKEKDNEIIRFEETVCNLESVQKDLKNDLNSAQIAVSKLEEKVQEKESVIQDLLTLIQSRKEEINVTKRSEASLDNASLIESTHLSLKSGAEKDELLEMADDSNSVAEEKRHRIAVSSDASVRLVEDTEGLQTKLMTKEDKLSTLEERVKKLVTEYADDVIDDETPFEDVLGRFETSLLAKRAETQALREQVEMAKRKVLSLKVAFKEISRWNDFFKGSGDGTMIEGDDLQENLNFLTRELKLIGNLSELLHRQYETEFEKKAALPPEIIIDMALRVEQLNPKDVLEASAEKDYEDCVREAGSRKCRNSLTTVPALPKSSAPFVTLVLLLSDAKKEAQTLKEKLSSTESTVRFLGSKVKHYRRLLCDSGLAGILSPLSPSETSCNGGPFSSCARDDSMPCHRATSRRSVSADDVTFGGNVLLTEDNQALSAEEILTAARTSPSASVELRREKSSVRTDDVDCTSSVFETCLQQIREGTKKSSQSRRCLSLSFDAISIDAFSPAIPESINDFGQTNDTLTLKEQIFVLRLHLEQCFQMIKEYEGKTKLHSSRADGASQTERQDDDNNGAFKVNSSLEAQHLQQQNEMLKQRVEMLLSEIPEGSHQNFMKLQQQELQSLRNHLFESHEACEVLRLRLEELADFLEYLLHYDENGLLDLSRFTPQRIASLQRHIAQSRELSNNLSQSLLAEGDVSVLSSCADLTMIKEQDNTISLKDCSSIHEQSMYLDQRLKEECDRKSQLISRLRLELEELKAHLRADDRRSLPPFKSFAPMPMQNGASGLYACQKQQMAESSSPSKRFVVGAEITEHRGHSRSSQQSVDTSQFVDAESSNLESHWKQPERKSPQAQKQSESSYDDLILLLNNKSDNSLKRISRQNSSVVRSFSKEADSSECNEMRTIEDAQEQAIIAEYVGGERSFLNFQKMPEDLFNANCGVVGREMASCAAQGKGSRQRTKMVVSPTDSESWSEPDRDVSQQRMGLEPEDGFFRSPGERSKLGRSPKSSSRHRCKSGSSNTECTSENFRKGNKINTSPGGSKCHADPVEVWHLQDHIQKLREINASLWSELQAYQSLLGDMVGSPSEKQNGSQSVLKSARRSLSSSLANSLLVPCNDSPCAQSKTHEILQAQLKEIRTLRHRTEQSIQVNELLREKLERNVFLSHGSESQRSPTGGKLRMNERQADEMHEESVLTSELRQQKLALVKQKQELEAETSLLKQQILELNEKINTKNDHLHQLHKTLSDRDDSGHQLKQANERLQSSLLQLQSSLKDKESICKELREANARMQRTLDAVDKLIAEKELQLVSLQKQHLEMIEEMKSLKQDHKDEIRRLTDLMSEMTVRARESEESVREASGVEMRKVHERYQDEANKLKELVAAKEMLVDECEKDRSNLRQQLARTEKKFDEMSTAMTEMEKHLEDEHGQNLTLQQKVSMLKRAIDEKDQGIVSLQSSVDELRKLKAKIEANRTELVEKIDDLESRLDERGEELKSKEHRIASLTSVVDKMQEEIAEKKKILKRQLETAQHLEEKVAVLSCSASEKEKRCQEERAMTQYLQEQIKSSEEELEKRKVESQRYQEQCRQLKDHLTEQEEKYLELQNKLDERGNAIRKLEEELHQSWEENEKLQTQCISAKTMLQETSNLNKAMKTELHVYERLHSSFLSSTADHKENRSPQKSSPKINVELLLDEFRNLRTQLELCIQTNCALRKQLEGQSVDIVEQVPTKESRRSSYKDNKKGSGSTENVFDKSPTLAKETRYSITKDSKSLSKSVMVVTDEENPLVKIPSVSTESGQFSDIESVHGNKEAHHHCSHSDENVLEVPCNSSPRSNRERFHKAQQRNETQKAEKQRPSRLALNRDSSSNTKTRAEMPDIHSVYSSPDLGIESDPSPFSCLESKLNNITEGHLWDIHRNYKRGGKHDLEVNSNCHSLYAIGHLDDYELLKKEVEDGLVILKKIQMSLKDRLHGNSTPKRNDDLTLKKLEKFVSSVDVCLGKCSQVVGLFWMALLPSNKSVKTEELEKLMQENYTLKKKIRHQRKSLNEYLQKLNVSNKTIEGMKKGITKQLLQTHDVLRKTKGNLQEQTKLMAKED